MDFQYYPYFRGKQFELIALREYATWKQKKDTPKKISPVIEPVRSNTSTLERTIDDLTKLESSFQVVVNPGVGDYAGRYFDFADLYSDRSPEDMKVDTASIVPAVIVSESSQSRSWRKVLPNLSSKSLTLIHDGSTPIPDLKSAIKKFEKVTHLFIGADLTIYAKQLGLVKASGDDKLRFVRVIDGFRPEARNVDYQPKDFFSENHLSFELSGYQGYGDFLVIGDKFSDSGGPARAVAIHLTYIDDDDLGRMYCAHFLSDTNDSPDDPGKKFLEADKKVVDAVNSKDSKLLRTPATDEFTRLFEARHFPGLGYVKKLSMLHHLYLMDDFLKE